MSESKCEHCGHGAGDHGARSGLCGDVGCECEVFVGAGPQPWEVERVGDARRIGLWGCTLWKVWVRR